MADNEQEVLEPEQDNLEQEEPEEIVEGQELSDEEQTESEDETEEQEEVKPKAASKKPYSAQELQLLLTSDGNIDTDRLTAEGKALMKSFQSGLTKKFQTVAQREKELEFALAEARRTSQRKPEPKEEAFQKFIEDPIGVTREINDEIARLEDVTPDMPQYREARKAIANLQAAKDEFRGKIELQRSQQAQQSQIIQQSVEALRRAIPNFETRQQELSDFAVNELGMSEQEIAYMTSPVFHGPMATKLVFAMNKLYEKVHAPATADKKLKKANPQPTMRSGSGNMGKVSAKPAALKNKAMQTGSSDDWAAYIQSIS